MFYRYENEDKKVLIARDKNQGSAFEKAGFELVGECDEKGRVTKKAEESDGQTEDE